MVSSKTFGASAIAVIGLVQMCPAPIEVVAAVIGGVVSTLNAKRGYFDTPKQLLTLSSSRSPVVLQVASPLVSPSVLPLSALS